MNKIKKITMSAFAAITTAFLTAQNAFAANNIRVSKAGAGTHHLLMDIRSTLLWLAPVVGAVCLIYCAIRKGAADEQDAKSWQKRINTVLICVVICELAVGVITLVETYYQ